MLQENQPVETDEFNNPVERWVDVVRFRAAVMPQGGREFVAAQQVHSALSLLLRARYTPTLKRATADMRLLYRDELGRERVLHLAAPPKDVDESHREIEFACIEAG